MKKITIVLICTLVFLCACKSTGEKVMEEQMLVATKVPLNNAQILENLEKTRTSTPMPTPTEIIPIEIIPIEIPELLDFNTEYIDAIDGINPNYWLFLGFCKRGLADSFIAPNNILGIPPEYDINAGCEVVYEAEVDIKTASGIEVSYTGSSSYYEAYCHFTYMNGFVHYLEWDRENKGFVVCPPAE